MVEQFYKTVDWNQIVSDFHSGEKHLQERAGTLAIKALKGFCITLMAKKYPTYICREDQDLLQSAYMAIWKNLPLYDPEKGEPSTFFAHPIQHAMMDHMNDSVNFTTVHYTQMENKIKQFDDSVSDEDVSKMTGISPKTVNRTRKIFKGNQKYYLDNFEDCGVMAQGSMSPEEIAIRDEERSLIQTWMDLELTQTEKEILYLSFGLEVKGLSYPTLTVTEIAEYLSLPRADVEETKQTALKKLANSSFSAVEFFKTEGGYYG